MQIRVVWPRKDCTSQTRILNRIITWSERGIEYEADPRHAEAIVRDLGLQGAKSVATPVEGTAVARENDEENLSVSGHKLFRALTAKALYLSAAMRSRGCAKYTLRFLSPTPGSFPPAVGSSRATQSSQP